MIRKIPFRRTLPFRLLVASIILLAIPLLVDSFVVVEDSYEDAIFDAKTHLMETAQLREVPLSALQPARKFHIQVLEHFLGLHEDFPAEPSKELEETLVQLATSDAYTDVMLVKIDPENKYTIVGSSNPKFLGKQYADFFSTQTLLQTATFKSGYFNFLAYSNLTFEPYFFSGSIVGDKEGVPTGILLVSRNIKDKLPDILRSENREYPVHFAALLSNTIVFAAQDGDLVFEYFAPIQEDEKQLLKNEQQFLGKPFPTKPISIKWLSYPFFEFMWKGEKQVGYFEKLTNAEILLFAYASSKDILAKPLFNFIDVYGVYLIILAVGGLTAYLLTKRMAKPMNQLTDVMERMQSGNLAVRYKSDPLGYEINQLGATFNEMVDTLLQKKAMAEEERIKREIYSKELKIGQQVQRSLLPEQMPHFPSVGLATKFIPAKQVGGDFYDVLLKAKGIQDQLVLVIADASGKGVQACFYSLGVRSMLRTYVKEYDDVGKVLSETNTLFSADTGDTGMFVTVFMAIYDPSDKRLDYYSCGHNPPLLRRNNGSIMWLNHLGGALGIHEKIEAQTQSIFLATNDLLIFYSDGITEAHNETFELYSEKRLHEFIARQEGKDPGQIAEDLMTELSEFVGKAPQHDDITLIVMKVL